jgi:hypothetical protein
MMNNLKQSGEYVGNASTMGTRKEADWAGVFANCLGGKEKSEEAD